MICPESTSTARGILTCPPRNAPLTHSSPFLVATLLIHVTLSRLAARVIPTARPISHPPTRARRDALFTQASTVSSCAFRGGRGRLIFHCAHRDQQFLSCSVLRARRTVCLLPQIILRPRVARARKIIRPHPLLCSANKKGTWPSVSRACIARLASNPYLFHPSRLAGRSSLRLRASNEGLPRPRVPRAQRSPLRPAPPLLPSRHVISLLNQTPHDCIGVGRVRLQRLIGATY